MPQASEIAWLIPVFPLIGAVLAGLGLISFNKKINNSRDIVSTGLLSFVGISAVISYKALIEQINGFNLSRNYLYGLMLAISQFQWDLSLILWGV